MIITDRLFLREFTESDVSWLFPLLKDPEVNRFLPWFPMKNLTETEQFLKERLLVRDGNFHLAILLKTGEPVGYIQAQCSGSHELGYGIAKHFWGNGYTAEAAAGLLPHLREAGLPFITATHDVNNPRSGRVMEKIGMSYRYSYTEQCQPKNFPVVFRMYQLDFPGYTGGTYMGYWERYPDHQIEKL